MTEKISQDSQPIPSAAALEREIDWQENNVWVHARAVAQQSYGEIEFQRIEHSLSCDNSAGPSLDRQELYELAARLIAESWRRDDEASYAPEQEQLSDVADALNQVLDKIETLDPNCESGRWLADTAKECSVPLRQIDSFLSSGRKIRDLFECAASRIPKRQGGRSRLAGQGVLCLAKYWHDKTGQSALTQNDRRGFEHFEEFAAAIVEPLRRAGINVPVPTNHQVRTVL